MMHYNVKIDSFEGPLDLLLHLINKLEIDIYEFSERYATAEVELPTIETPVSLPEWLEVIAEVTDKQGYSNFSLSRSLKFPEEAE